MTADEVMALIRASDKPHYVYVLSRPCGTPFYVGIGTARRFLDHEIFARRAKLRSRKLSVIRKIWREGGQVVYSIYGWFGERGAAERAEAELVLKIGRSDLGTGTLTNATSGGEGASGISDEGRARKSAKAKEAWAVLLADEKKRTASLSAMHSPSARAKAAASRTGQKRPPYKPRDSSWVTDELRAARSAFLKADPVSKRPGVAAKISAAKLGKSVPNHWTKDPSKVWTRGAHPRAVAVELDGQTFACIADAADHFGVVPETIARWMKNPEPTARGRWPKSA